LSKFGLDENADRKFSMKLKWNRGWDSHGNFLQCRSTRPSPQLVYPSIFLAASEAFDDSLRCIQPSVIDSYVTKCCLHCSTHRTGMIGRYYVSSIRQIHPASGPFNLKTSSIVDLSAPARLTFLIISHPHLSRHNVVTSLIHLFPNPTISSLTRMLRR